MYVYDGTTPNILSSPCSHTIAAFQFFPATFLRSGQQKAPFFLGRPDVPDFLCCVMSAPLSNMMIMYILVPGEREPGGAEKEGGPGKEGGREAR